MQLPTSLPTQTYQVALFSLNPISVNWNILFAALIQLEEFRNGENFIVPATADMPSELPRVILRSENKIISCSISLEKIDFFWSNIDDIEDFSVSPDDRIALVSRVVNNINSNLLFKRVGSIRNFYLSTQSSDPVKLEILQDTVTDELRDYALRLSYQETILETKCNYVLDLTSACL